MPREDLLRRYDLDQFVDLVRAVRLNITLQCTVCIVNLFALMFTNS